MKTLILRLIRNSGGNIMSLGFDIIWNNSSLKFNTAESLGLFNIASASIVEGETNKITLAAANTVDPVVFDGDFLKITFEFSGNEQNVVFNIENLTAKDENGNDISVVNDVKNIEIETRWTIEWIWQ